MVVWALVSTGVYGAGAAVVFGGSASPALVKSRVTRTEVLFPMVFYAWSAVWLSGVRIN